MEPGRIAGHCCSFARYEVRGAPDRFVVGFGWFTSEVIGPSIILTWAAPTDGSGAVSPAEYCILIGESLSEQRQLLMQETVFASSLVFEPVQSVADNNDTAGHNKGPGRNHETDCQETISGLFPAALADHDIIDFRNSQLPFRC